MIDFDSLPTLSSALDQLRSGVRTPTDLVEECLAQIDRLEPQVQAWVMVDAAGARKLATEQTLDYQHGTPLGPLAGIPIGVKDIIDVAGWPTKAGSPLRENHIAEADAPVVAALRKAGAIILGKTVTTQFACFDPSKTRNPHNLDHSPGGSSSGSAAAVTCGMCYAALATQTGGSITRPAAYCGIAGLKPTFGTVSMEGIVPVSPRLDHVGVVARSAEDLEAVWKVIGPGSTTIAPVQFPVKLLGLDPGLVASTDPEIIVQVLELCLRFNKHGAQVAAMPGGVEFFEPRTWAYHRQIMAHDAASYHAVPFRGNPEGFASGLASLLREGQAVSAQDYKTALSYQREHSQSIDEWFTFVDAIITPATTSLAPPLSAHSTGDPRWNSPFSLSGHPTVTIPVGLGLGNLPWGIQIVGAYGREIDLLHIAQWIESVLSHHSATG